MNIEGNLLFDAALFVGGAVTWHFVYKIVLAVVAKVKADIAAGVAKIHAATATAQAGVTKAVDVANTDVAKVEKVADSVRTVASDVTAKV